MWRSYDCAFILGPVRMAANSWYCSSLHMLLRPVALVDQMLADSAGLTYSSYGLLKTNLGPKLNPCRQQHHAPIWYYDNSQRRLWTRSSPGPVRYCDGLGWSVRANFLVFIRKLGYLLRIWWLLDQFEWSANIIIGKDLTFLATKYCRPSVNNEEVVQPSLSLWKLVLGDPTYKKSI